MAKKADAYLTFAVTLPQPKGVSIPIVRQTIIDALKKECHVEDIKVHLTNKEVKYA